MQYNIRKINLYSKLKAQPMEKTYFFCNYILKCFYKLKIIISIKKHVVAKNKFMFECNVAVDELMEQAKIVHKNDCLMKEGFNLNNRFRNIWDN